MCVWAGLTRNLRAQDRVQQAQHYLDQYNVTEHPEAWDTVVVVDSMSLGSQGMIITREVTFDCNGDVCYDTQSGLVTYWDEICLPVFDNIMTYGDGDYLFIGKYNFIADAGLKVKVAFDDAQIHEEVYMIILRDGKQGLMDLAGKEILPTQYDHIEPFDHHGRLAALKENQWTIYTKDSLMPDWVHVSGSDWDLERMIELIAIDRGEGQGLLNEDGKLVTALEFDEVQPFAGGYAAVRKNEFWALVNYEGEVLTPFKYTKFEKAYTWDYFLAKIYGNYGIINNEGKELTEFNFQQVGEFFIYDDQIGLYNFVKVGWKQWGVIDREGQPISAMDYESIRGIYPEIKGLKNDTWVDVVITKE